MTRLAEVHCARLSVVAVDAGVSPWQSFVWGISGEFGQILKEDSNKASRQLLEMSQKEAQGHHLMLETRVCKGSSVSSVLEAVAQVKADLVIFGIAPHSGMGNAIFTCKEIGVGRQACCDVLGVH
jgi:nucleotide-binding universal stress UspA family protein